MLVALAVFVLLVALTRYVSLGSIAGAAAALVTVLVTPNPLPARLLVVVGAALIIFRHRRNIQRLLAGTEARLGERVRQS
jgi:glycerol-3-phosphate acyltransferase PlsY